MKNKEKQILKFSVIDNKTGEYPDLYTIALKEDWAKGLLYCDMDGFSVNEDGQLILSDDCGKFVYCPSDRFTVVFEDSVVLSREEYESDLTAQYDVGYEFGRKETAERDFNTIIKALEERKERVKAFYGIAESVGADIAIRTVKELAKQFGVEIKE